MSNTRTPLERGAVSDFVKWLEQLAGPKALTLFLACACIKLVNAQGLISLHDIHPSAAAVNDVVAVLSGFFTAPWVVEAIKRWRVRRAEAKRHRQAIRRFLRNLRPDEEQSLRSHLRFNL